MWQMTKLLRYFVVKNRGTFYMQGRISFFANVICVALVLFASSSFFRIAENKAMSSQVELHFSSPLIAA